MIKAAARGDPYRFRRGFIALKPPFDDCSLGPLTRPVSRKLRMKEKSTELKDGDVVEFRFTSDALELLYISKGEAREG